MTDFNLRIDGNEGKNLTREDVMDRDDFMYAPAIIDSLVRIEKDENGEEIEIPFNDWD